MATPKKNVAYTFSVSLGDAANPGKFKANPTIASGDFKVSTDGAALGNLTTLPVVTPAGSTSVLISLSQAEMNGDKIVVEGIDAAGAEWDDTRVFIDTTESTIDDVASDVTAIKAKTDNLPSAIAKNVALPNFSFLMVDSADDVSGKTGLTVAGTISKDGGAFASLTNTGTIAEIGNGVYSIDLTQAEMNADMVVLRFAATGANDRTISIHTDT